MFVATRQDTSAPEGGGGSLRNDQATRITRFRTRWQTAIDQGEERHPEAALSSAIVVRVTGPRSSAHFQRGGCARSSASLISWTRRDDRPVRAGLAGDTGVRRTAKETLPPRNASDRGHGELLTEFRRGIRRRAAASLVWTAMA